MSGVNYTNTCLDDGKGEVFTLNILLSGQLPSTFYESQYVLETTTPIMWLKLPRLSAV